MLEGVCSIVEGLNPKLIRVKLENFAPAAAKEAAAESQKGAAKAALAAKG
jgi:flagellar motor component MotA